MNNYIKSLERLTIAESVLNARRQIIKIRYDMYHKYIEIFEDEPEIRGLLAHADKLLKDAYDKIKSEDE